MPRKVPGSRISMKSKRETLAREKSSIVVKDATPDSSSPEIRGSSNTSNDSNPQSQSVSAGEKVGSMDKRVSHLRKASSGSQSSTDSAIVVPQNRKTLASLSKNTSQAQVPRESTLAASAHDVADARAPVAISFASSAATWELDDEDVSNATVQRAYGLDENLWRRDHTFDKLRDIYMHTIAGLDASEAKGVNLDPIRKLFVKLWNGIDDSHENVLRLEKKDHDISVELSVVMAKTRTLIKMSEEDPELGARLRGKLESAWGLADVGEAEERKNAIKIAELREDIFMLNRNINAAVKTEGQATVLELKKLKGQFEVQRNVVASEVAKLRSDLTMTFEKRRDIAELKTNLEEKLKLLNEEEVVHQESIVRERSRKERLQRAIQDTIGASEQKAVTLAELVQNLNLAESRLTDVERYAQEQRVVNDDVLHELEIANNKAVKFKQDYEAQAKLCEKLNTDLFKRQIDLKEKEDEVSVARNLVSRMNRQKQANLKKMEEFKAIISEIEEERDKLKEKLTVLEKELEAAQRKLGENKRKIEAMDRERAIANRALEHAVAAVDAKDGQRMTHELAVRNLQTDIGGYEKEIQSQEGVIAHLEKERDNYSHEAMKLAHQVAVRLEEAKKLDRTIYEYTKKLGKVETQLKKQQHVYENAVYEKALTQRQLRDALNDALENGIKLAHLGHEIMALKFIVGEKDTIIHIEASRYERVLRETTFYAGEGKRLKHMAYDMQRMVEALAAEQFVLKKTVGAIESEIGKQSYYANTAESRKQVFRRKEMAKEQELKEIWEKWRVLHSEIRIGASHLRNLVWDIRRLRIQIFETRKENIVKSHGKTHARKLQHEISVLENVISKETCMCNSLRESMRHPINVHRWRVLECTNPDAYDMVIKANLLSKRLIERNALIRKQDEDLRYKQEIYCQIREALAKAPNVEIPENLSYYRHLVAAKRRHYQSLQTELRSALLHAKYYEEELTTLQDSFGQLKTKWFRKMEENGCSYSVEYPEDENDPGIPNSSATSVANYRKLIALQENGSVQPSQLALPPPAKEKK